MRTQIRKGVVLPIASKEDVSLVNAFLKATSEMKQGDAANLAGVSQQTISRWRAGDIRRLRAETRARLVEVLHPDAESREGYNEETDTLLTSPRQLYATLSNFGEPGKRTGDKLFMVRLLLDVAEDLRREGKRFPIDHLLEAQRKIENGEI